MKTVLINAISLETRHKILYGLIMSNLIQNQQGEKGLTANSFNILNPAFEPHNSFYIQTKTKNRV